MKTYLLIAGHNYYPSSGTGDWIESFETYAEAKAKVEEITNHKLFTEGKRKGEIKRLYTTIHINGCKYDWYEIIDLKVWINK